jgi:nitrogen-specific signal transduction histidine kinase
MDENEIRKYVLDAFPYPVIFVDTDHIIRYLNKAARYRYYEVRGYGELIGKSVFECHSEGSKEKILQAVEKLKNHGNEIF